ncbi:MAG: hypothetical protein HYY04_02125 [Chloroflexi bacterium]|nr:hypothetical protein [Chloroflexota bacterium]
MTLLVTPIIFVGGCPADPVEAVVARAQQAVALDTIEKLLSLPECARPIVATADPVFAARLADWPVEVARDRDDEFHFGRYLAELVARHRIEVPLYIGGGSGPLLSVEDLRSICVTLLATPGALVANNFFSSDFVGFHPGAALSQIDPPSIDNDLAFRLQRQAGLKNVALTRTAGTQMDVDTPTDLMVLAIHPNTGRRTRAYLATLDLDLRRLRAAMRLLTEPTAEVVVCGRVSSHVWAHLETDLACRKRVFSEERGMRASGREQRGEVRSLLGMHLEAVGPRRFFTGLADLGQAAFVDTRVIFQHLRLTPSAGERFRSDLLLPDGIADLTIRAFTAAARDAAIPVLLGGHSLVAGGLWALIEAAWLERDQEGGASP